MSPESFEITEEDESSELMTPDEVPSIPITVPPGRSTMAIISAASQELDISQTMVLLSTSDNTLTNSETESFYDPSKEDLDQAAKSITGMDKSMESFEIRTQISDSTHSFEEIHPSKLKSIPSEEAGSKTKTSGSGPSSGDELETATSSDIEIISSPNGDSSSTASFTNIKLSPGKSDGPFPYQNSESFLQELKLDRKGHSRELSEASVLSLASDDLGSPNESEKLMKRVSELSEVLEQREYKLVQIGRNNAELLDANARLIAELEATKRSRNSMDMNNIQEEYTQRLSVLEKKFQQAVRENSALKKQTDILRAEMDAKVSRNDHEQMITEKENVIETLKSEGEKLSKQVLSHSNIIKKLRAKLKENDDTLKRQETQINELSDENQKLKRTLTTKDEIEKSQTEGINKLTSDKRKLDKENQQLKSQNEDMEQKFLALQMSHDALKKELNDKSNALVRNLEDEKEKAQMDNQQAQKELIDLRQKIRDVESSSTAREQKLRQENIELKRKLEETEFRIEDQKQEASLASIPLIRQLESLQSTLNIHTKAWEKQEKCLLDKLDEAQSQLKAQTDIERQAKDQLTHQNLKVGNLEEKLSLASLKLEQIAGQLQQQQIEFQLHENDFKSKINQLEYEALAISNDAEKFKSLVAQLENKLRQERDEFEEEKRKLMFLQQQPPERSEHEMGNVSPALSIGHISDESLHSHPWNLVSFCDCSEIVQQMLFSFYCRMITISEQILLIAVNMVALFNRQHL